MNRNEDGLTLIELLVALMLSVILITAISGAFIAFLQNSDSATRRISASRDAQIVAAYFVTDIQSSLLSSGVTLTAITCPAYTGVAKSDAQFLAVKIDSAPTIINYVVRTKWNLTTHNVTDHQLVRVDATSSSPESVVAQNLKVCTPGLADTSVSIAGPAVAPTACVTNCFKKYTLTVADLPLDDTNVANTFTFTQDAETRNNA